MTSMKISLQFILTLASLFLRRQLSEDHELVHRLSLLSFVYTGTVRRFLCTGQENSTVTLVIRPVRAVARRVDADGGR